MRRGQKTSAEQVVLTLRQFEFRRLCTSRASKHGARDQQLSHRT